MADEKQLVVNLALKAGTMKQQINSINKDIKQMKTDFKNAGAGVEDFEKTSEGLSAKLKLQQSVVDKLKDKLEVYKTEQEKCTATLDKAISAYQKQDKEVEALRRTLEEARATYGKTSTEVKELEDQLEKAEKALETKRNTIINADNALKNAKNNITSTEIEIKAMERQISQTSNALEDLESSANEAADGVEELEESSSKLTKFMGKLKENITETSKESLDFNSKMSMVGQGLVTVGDKASEAGKKIFDGLGSIIESGAKYEEVMKRLQLQTGATDKEMQQYKSTIKEIYNSGLGENLDQVAEAFVKVKTQTNLTGAELQTLTEKALQFSQSFCVDVHESVRTVNTMMNQFGVSSDEAFNLLIQGQQQGLDYSGELLDSIIEYSPHFKQLGLSAEDMFSVMVDGAKSGAFNLDKVGDAVKELGIRVKEGNKDAVLAFEQLGLSSDEMVQKFNNGGTDAQEAFYKIFEALKTVDDQTELNSIGTALMGTMYEDLGKDAVLALGDMSDEFNRTIDKTEELNGASETTSNSFERVSRTIEDMKTTIAEQLMPVLEPLIQKVSDIVGKISEWASENPEATRTIVLIVGALGALLAVVGPIIGLIGSLTLAVMAFNLAALPITGTVALIALGITALIAVIILMIAKWDEIVACWNSFCEWAKELWTEFKTWIVEKFTEIKDKTVAKVQEMKDKVVEKWTEIKTTVTTKVQELKDGVINKWTEIKTSVTDKVQELKDGVVGKFNEIKTSVTDKVQELKDGVVNKFTEIKDRITSTFSNVYSTITSPFTDAWSYISGIGDKISGVISKINPFKSRSLDMPINATVDASGISSFGLDNIALSGSYYNATTRDSLNANNMIKQVNGSSQALAFDMMMNKMTDILSDMSKAMQDLKSNNGIEQTVIINSPKSLSPSEIARENKKALREMAFKL